MSTPQTAEETIALLRASIAREETKRNGVQLRVVHAPCDRCSTFSAVARPAVCPTCRALRSLSAADNEDTDAK